MRDRAFGVEIECGYNGDGPVEPECICEVYDAEEGRWIDNPDPEYHCVSCCGCWESDEGNSLGCEEAARLLYDNGFHSWTEDIHPDGSGVEIPSPILSGVQGLHELREVMELLSRNGFYTSERDGMHVHHDAPEFVENPELTARLVELWEENLPIIDRFVAPGRRGGRHWACNSYSAMRGYGEQTWEKFKANKSLDNLYTDKFRSLNITPLGWHGTIEFRLHEGTLDFNKARAWIMFGQALLETAKRRKTIVTCATPLDLLRATRTSSRVTRTLIEAAA